MEFSKVGLSILLGLCIAVVAHVATLIVEIAKM
jgi:hypothetical protein